MLQISQIFNKQFIILTIIGNGFIFIFASLTLYVEKDTQSQIKTFMDALWYSFSTVTTVGYGDITPITFWGRILGILQMLLGSALFATFTGFFANAFLGKGFSKIKRQLDLEEQEIEEMLLQMKEITNKLELKKEKEKEKEKSKII